MGNMILPLSKKANEWYFSLLDGKIERKSRSMGLLLNQLPLNLTVQTGLKLKPSLTYQPWKEEDL